MPTRKAKNADVTVVETATVDGVDEAGDAQGITLLKKTGGTTSAAELQVVGDHSGLPTIRIDGPLTCIAEGTHSLTAGEPLTVFDDLDPVIISDTPVLPLRRRTIQHQGANSDGYVYVRWSGTDAANPTGIQLAPGQSWSEECASMVSVIAVTDTVIGYEEAAG
jgi:hypothetical protein